MKLRGFKLKEENFVSTGLMIRKEYLSEMKKMALQQSTTTTDILDQILSNHKHLLQEKFK